MYKTSDDRRFQKNKAAMRRAFLDLVIERGYQGLTVSDITKRADLNRMTFYGHYESIEDIFREFIDEMEHEIAERAAREEKFSVDGLFTLLNELMYREIDFFRHAARTNAGPDFKTAFKDAIARLLMVEDPDREGSRTEIDARQQLIICDQIAVCIAYSYLDWLSGRYGDASLDEVIGVTKSLLARHLPLVTYRPGSYRQEV